MNEASLAYGYINPAFVRPPQLAGCERVPFLMMLGIVVFTVVVVFGVSPSGLIGGILMAIAGRGALKQIAAYDPYFFAVWGEAIKLPRSLPDVLPEDRIALPSAVPSTGERTPTTRDWVRALGKLVAVGSVLSGLCLLGWLFLVS